MKTAKRISFAVTFALVFGLLSMTAFASSAKTWTLPNNSTNQVTVTNVTEEGQVDYSNSMGGLGLVSLFKVEANSKITLKEAATVEICSAAYHTDNADKRYKGINEYSNAPINKWDGKGSYDLKGGLYLIYVEDEVFAVEVAASGTTTTPGTPEPPKTTAPEKASAVPTVSKVLVDGKSVAFDAYNIGGNNYFKLRDLANAVTSSEKHFDVSWDGAKNAINLKSNAAYTKVGGEMAKSDGKAKNAVLSTSKVYKDGTELNAVAYNIGGNNYFKLRDVAKAFNILVTWDSQTNTIGIDTAIDYME